jgi:Cu(I)/Ag(I) efflux system membrane protein CusA/SilA
VDPGRFVENAKEELKQTIGAGGLNLRQGERIEWTGQYELIAQGEKRLRWIVPFVLLSMFVLLLLLFRSVAEAAIVLLCVPFALVGSLWTLYWLGYPLSAPVWVGLLSTIGLAMQTGVVMVVYIDDAFHRRVQSDRIHARDDIVDAHTEGTVLRLRPKLMTIATMAASLLPLLWAEGAGAEIIRRVAAPMLGGLLSSAFLTLEVIPVVYTMWRSHQLEVAKRRKVRLAEVIGPVPTWAQA